jgi:hypothetical protein
VINTQESGAAWPATRLGRLNPRSTARLTLSSWPGSESFGCWVLEQAGNPIGLIRRAGGTTSFRTPSEEWLLEVRRPRRRLGWQLEFRRSGERAPTVCYYPHTLLGGGRLVVSGERRYRLRRPIARADWRVTARRGGDLGRIAFRGGCSPEDLRTHVAFGKQATAEPLLLVVILAASVAILIHNEEPRAPVYHG